MASVYHGQELVDPYASDRKDFLVRAEHLMRYVYARHFIRKQRIKTVYDIACGNGYGSVELAEAADMVIAIDKNKPFIAEAIEKHGRKNIDYRRIDLDTDSLPSEPNADLIVSFETLEHLENPAKTVSEMHGLLKPKGYLLLSVPNKRFEPKRKGKPRNTFHKHLFTRTDINNLLSDFKIVQNLSQPYSNYIVTHSRTFSRFINRCCMRRGFLLFARLFAYPCERFIDRSYSMIILAQKR